MNNGLSIFRYTAALAASTLAVIALGAVVTGELQPVPKGALAPEAASAARLAHAAAATVIVVLILILAMWLQSKPNLGWVRRLGWIAVASAVAEAGLGSAKFPAAGFFHAALAPLLFSLVLAIAVGLSRGPQNPPLVAGPDRVRPLSMAAVAFTFLQVMLGAAYRHGLINVLWHIVNALIVAILIILLCMTLLRELPAHRTLRPWAMVLALVTGLQIGLGFAAFIMLLLGTEGQQLLSIGVFHTATAALTLGACMGAAMEISRSVKPPEQDQRGQ